MSRCAYCRHELPGLETICQQCFEKGYDGLVHPKPWWYRLQPRLTRGKFVGFFILFIFSFVLFRFDFPDFRARHMKTTETSSLISVLIACVAFFYESRGQSESLIVPRRNFEARPILGRVMLLVAVELIAGLTAQEGWDTFKNGELLAAAEAAGFDVLRTSDKNIRYQQDLSQRKIAIVVLGEQQWPRLRPHIRRVVEAVNLAQPGSYTEVDLPAEPKPSRPEHGS